MRKRRGPRPILWLVLGCAGLLVGGILTIYQWDLLKKYPDQPASVSLSQAVDWLRSPTPSGWVTLSGGQWQCAGLRIYDAGKTQDTDIVYRGDASAAVLATFDGALACADFNDKPVTGVLQPLDDQGQAKARQENLYLASLPAGDRVIALCGDCGPANDQTGMLIGASLFVLGLFMLNMARQDAEKLRSGVT